jgi:hypothetical protein
MVKIWYLGNGRVNFLIVPSRHRKSALRRAGREWSRIKAD